MAVHQAVEYASPCRLADGRRNSGDCSVNMVLDIHSLMVDELFMSGNWHTPDMQPTEFSIERIGRRKAIEGFMATDAALTLGWGIRRDHQEDINDDNVLYPLPD
jgi:hypothetical protein